MRAEPQLRWAPQTNCGTDSLPCAGPVLHCARFGRVAAPSLVDAVKPDAGLANIRSAIALDQLNPEGYARLSIGLTYAHQYREAQEIERKLKFPI